MVIFEDESRNIQTLEGSVLRERHQGFVDIMKAAFSIQEGMMPI
jgi:hypothetical protein